MFEPNKKTTILLNKPTKNAFVIDVRNFSYDRTIYQMIKNREIHTSYIVNNIPYNKIYMVLEYFTRKNVVSLQLICFYEVKLIEVKL